MAESYRFVVTGRVQGVFFRQSTVDQARSLGVSGWVRNREDGAVEGVATGTPESLELLRAWLSRGPPAARVTQLDWIEAEAPPLSGFAIQR